MPDLAYMIDESHNLKDPLEDLIQATDAIQHTLAQALCVDRDELADAQDGNDPAPRRRGAAPRLPHRRASARRRGPPAQRRAPSTRSATYRASGYRAAKIDERGTGAVATGL